MRKLPTDRDSVTTPKIAQECVRTHFEARESTCAMCAAPYLQRRAWQRFCSSRCRKAASDAKRLEAAAQRLLAQRRTARGRQDPAVRYGRPRIVAAMVRGLTLAAGGGEA